MSRGSVMGTPHVILVRAAYYGILSLLTDFAAALSAELLKTRRGRRHQGRQREGNTCPASQFMAPLATLKALLVFSVSTHPVARSSKVHYSLVWNEPLFLPRVPNSLRWCCPLTFRRRRVSKGRRTSTVACECCSHRGFEATNV